MLKNGISMNKNMIYIPKLRWQDVFLFESKKHFALIDTGEKYKYNEIISFINKHNVKTIDFIIITHFHKDHYGNLSQILDTFNVNKVYIKDYSNLEKYTEKNQIANKKYRDLQLKTYND